MRSLTEDEVDEYFAGICKLVDKSEFRPFGRN